MPDQSEVPRIVIENAVSITGASLYQHKNGIYELVIASSTRTLELQLSGTGHYTGPQYCEFDFLDCEVTYAEDAGFETVRVYLDGEFWRPFTHNKDQIHIFLIPFGLTTASGAIVRVESTPSTETAMSSIDDNTEKPDTLIEFWDTEGRIKRQTPNENA